MVPNYRGQALCLCTADVYVRHKLGIFCNTSTAYFHDGCISVWC